VTMNLKARQDYMDVDYVNGVYDDKGREVMRKMTDQEKDWLAQFYKEWLNADRSDSKLYSSDEEWKDIYGENNARNRCILNKAKKMGKLDSFDTKSSDKRFVKEIGDSDLELMITHDPNKDGGLEE
jgi:hypothetical protein